jgi:hypothetical protein
VRRIRTPFLREAPIFRVNQHARLSAAGFSGHPGDDPTSPLRFSPSGRTLLRKPQCPSVGDVIRCREPGNRKNQKNPVDLFDWFKWDNSVYMLNSAIFRRHNATGEPAPHRGPIARVTVRLPGRRPLSSPSASGRATRLGLAMPGSAGVHRSAYRSTGRRLPSRPLTR